MSLVTWGLVRLSEDVLLAILVNSGVLDTDSDVVDFLAETEKVEDLHGTGLKAICATDGKRVWGPVEDTDSDALANKAGSGSKADGTS